MQQSNRSLVLRITLPVIFENIFSVAVGLLFSAFTGQISGTALVAYGTGNTFLSMLQAGTSCITTSSAVVVARLCGEKDKQGAARIAEQGTLLSLALSVLLSGLVYLLTEPVLSLLAPGADEALKGDLRTYLRILMLSFPLLMFYSENVSVLRATGDTRSASTSSMFLCASQLFFGWLFIARLNMGMVGAGLSLILCRAVGTILSTYSVFFSHRDLPATLRGIFRPDRSVIFRMLRLGIPSGLEGLCVQAGYLVTNSLVVGLGSSVSSVYQVMNTVQGFPSLTQSISSTIAVPLVGLPLGAGDRKGAKKAGLAIFFAAFAVEMVLFFIVMLMKDRMCGFFTTDPDVLATSSKYLWLLVFYLITGQMINTFDPALRTGGDTRFVMIVTALAVWAVRIPLVYLFCYKMGMGVVGALLANYLSLTVRAVCGIIRYLSGRWMDKKV